MSIPGALSNPIGDAVASNSIINIIKILAEAISSIIVAFSVLSGNDIFIYIIII